MQTAMARTRNPGKHAAMQNSVDDGALDNWPVASAVDRGETGARLAIVPGPCHRSA